MDDSEKRIINIENRIENLEKEMKVMTKNAENMDMRLKTQETNYIIFNEQYKQIDKKLDQILTDQKKQAVQFDELKSKPVKRYDRIIDQVIGAVVGAIIVIVLVRIGLM